MDDIEPTKLQVSKKNRSKGIFPLFLILLSLIISTAGVLAARGNGAPPSLYFIAALILFPLLASHIGRFFRRRRLAELIVLVLCGLVCMAIAWRTSRVAPREVFIHIFKIPPPPSATAMESRKQWYDGRIWLLRCDLSQSDFQSLVASAGLKKVELDETDSESLAYVLNSRWKTEILTWSGIAYGFWPQTQPEGDIEIYHAADAGQADNGDVIATNIFRSKTTGRTWIVRLD